MTTFNLIDRFREQTVDLSSAIDREYIGTPAGAVLHMLIASALTVNQNTNLTLGDITYTEVTGTGYTAGGNACANATVTLDGSGNVDWDADDPATWAQNGGGFTDGRFAILAYNNGGAQSTWPLVGYSAQFASDVGNVAGPLTVSFDNNGILRAPR